jgi:hypothetical protein
MTRFEQSLPDDIPPIDGFDFEQRTLYSTGEIFDVYRRKRVELLLGQYGRQAIVEDLDAYIPSLWTYFLDMEKMVSEENITPPEDFTVLKPMDLSEPGFYDAMVAFQIPCGKQLRAIANARNGMISNFLRSGSENHDIGLVSAKRSRVAVVLADFEYADMHELTKNVSAEDITLALQRRVFGSRALDATRPPQS